MAGVVTLDVLGSSPLAKAVRATTLGCEEPLAWICEATTDPRVVLNLVHLTDARLIVVSSPVPVGTIRWLEEFKTGHQFAYIPENVRRASAVEDFQDTDRFVIGTRSQAFYQLLAHMLSPITQTLLWVTPESAEMTKLALNTFLRMNIGFMHEIEVLCLSFGADADEVSRALLTERRISPSAPLRPGPSWGGDHLARDVETIRRMARDKGVLLPLISQLRSEP